MKLLCEKKFWCVIGIFFYVSYVFRINEEYCYENVFAGVKFMGMTILCRNLAVIRSCAFLFVYGHGKIHKRVGVLYVTRHRKRSRDCGKYY